MKGPDLFNSQAFLKLQDSAGQLVSDVSLHAFPVGDTAADYFQVSQVTIRKWIRSGCPSVTIQGTRMIREQDVLLWCTERAKHTHTADLLRNLFALHDSAVAALYVLAETIVKYDRLIAYLPDHSDETLRQFFHDTAAAALEFAAAVAADARSQTTAEQKQLLENVGWQPQNSDPAKENEA